MTAEDNAPAPKERQACPVGGDATRWSRAFLFQRMAGRCDRKNPALHQPFLT